LRVGRRTIGAHGGVISPADDTGGQDVRADLLCQGRSAAPGSCRRCLHRVIHGVAFRLQRCSCRSARERIRRASERQRRHEADCIIRQSVWRPFRVVRASGRRRTLSGRRRPGRTAAADSLAGCSCAILASSSGEGPMIRILAAGGRWIRTIGPCREGGRFILRKVNWRDRRGSQKILRGTDGSNPSPSSSESSANPAQSRGFIDDDPCRPLVAAGGGVGFEAVDRVRSGRHGVNVLARVRMFQWNWRSVMRRRIFGRELKIEGVKLTCGRGVSVAQAD